LIVENETNNDLKLVVAPEICFRVGSAQLFAVEGGENFLKLVMMVF
jgi:hypothetical protein